MSSIFSVSFWIDLGLIVLGIFLFILTVDYPEMAGTFPRLVLIMIMIVTLLDMIVTVRKPWKDKAVENTRQKDRYVSPRQQLKVFYMAGLVFVFFFLIILFGVILGAFIFMIISGWTLGYKKIKYLFISSVIITVSVHVIFKVIMKSFLPQGLIFTIIGG